MIHIRQDVLPSLVSLDTALDNQREAFMAFAGGDYCLPLRTRYDWPEHQLRTLVMPVTRRHHDLLSIKTVNVSDSGQVAGLITLYHVANGEPLAIIDAEYLTALRTAAASALATMCYAKSDAQVLGVFGYGAQAQWHVRAMVKVRPIKQVHLYIRASDDAKRNATAVAQSLAQELNLSVLIHTELASLKRCEIICCCTPATAPLFALAQLGEQVHINAIGAFRPDMCELPPELMCDAQICVDDRTTAWTEAGDLIQAEKAGHITRDTALDTLGEQLLGDKNASSSVNSYASANESTTKTPSLSVFKSLGLAFQDHAIASLAFARFNP